MGTKPDELRAEIEATRNQLSADLDQLADKVSPAKVAHRTADDAKAAALALKDRAVQATDGLRPKVAEGTERMRQSAGSAAQTVKGRLDAHPAVADKAYQAAGGASHASKAAVEQAREHRQQVAAGLGAALLALVIMTMIRRHRCDEET